MKITIGQFSPRSRKFIRKTARLSGLTVEQTLDAILHPNRAAAMGRWLVFAEKGWDAPNQPMIQDHIKLAILALLRIDRKATDAEIERVKLALVGRDHLNRAQALKEKLTK